ncbi:YeeE/YedE family protein [Lacibacterium aquatile]|uniref:YeeE/YedE family protein n=1 Tax=Lacibacterium aquatile TaxID=1168082 RepID=A0ABW5DR09_9PROT
MFTNLMLPAIGGLLIGLSAALFLLLNGRIVGISGLAAQATGLSREGSLPIAVAFIVGMLGGTFIVRYLLGWPTIEMDVSWPILIIGGLLVGYGTRLGSGCTSGHGVCGLARFSTRSIVATGVFMSTAIITVLLIKLIEGRL